MLVLGADDELTAESRRVGMVICCLASRVEQRSTVRKGLASTRSAHDARFEVVDHGPESIDLASLDDFQGPQATERRVGGVEPSWDGLVLDQPGESLSQADELLDAATRWFVDWLSAFPVGDRSLGETREPGEHFRFRRSRARTVFTERGSVGFRALGGTGSVFGETLILFIATGPLLGRPEINGVERPAQVGLSRDARSWRLAIGLRYLFEMRVTDSITIVERDVSHQTSRRRWRR